MAIYIAVHVTPQQWVQSMKIMNLIAWPRQHSALATTCQLQHDQTLSLSAKGVACKTNMYSYSGRYITGMQSTVAVNNATLQHSELLYTVIIVIGRESNLASVRLDSRNPISSLGLDLLL